MKIYADFMRQLHVNNEETRKLIIDMVIHRLMENGESEAAAVIDYLIFENERALSRLRSWKIVEARKP